MIISGAMRTGVASLTSEERIAALSFMNVK